MTRGWETTRPLANADFGAALLVGRCKARNPVVVLRASNLVGLECDTEEDLARIETLQLPATATVCSSKPYKRHFYFRPPLELESLPYVGFRFESGKLTADTGRYFVCPPAVHPTGVLYEFLPGRTLDEIGVATIPVGVYRQLCAEARASRTDTATQLREDPGAKVREGQRRDSLFRYACALRRWTADRDEIALAVHEWNRRHCDPVLDAYLVDTQIDGAMKKPGSQSIRSAA